MEFFLLIFILTIAGLLIFTGFYFSRLNINRLNFVQRFILEQLCSRWEKYESSLDEDKKALMDYETLLRRGNFLETGLVERIFEIKPAALGFNGPFYSREKGKDIELIPSVTFGSGRSSGVRYLPSHVKNDFDKMAEAFNKETGKKIFVDSGYRAAGRQAFLFIHYLVRDNDYSLRENAKWIAMPGYSEHNSPVNTAVDISDEDGINGFSDGQKAEDFETLEVYNWLTKKGAEYNFFLSYPKNNRFGVAFEPWHWHWEGKPGNQR